MKYIVFIIVFAALACVSKPNDELIVLINIEEFEGKMRDIAKGISLLDSLKPKVISIAFQFPDEYSDEKSDNELALAFSDYRANLILCNDIDYYDEQREDYPGFRVQSYSKFIPAKAKTGFINLVSEIDPFQTISKFSTWERVNGKIEYSFGVQTAILFDSIKATDFLKRRPKINDINFHDGKKFKSFELLDIISGKVRREEIEGKIVIIGFLGPGYTDRFYSGAIKRGNGSFEPDMYSAEFQANIVLQVLLE